jgi:hypothetical protein
LSGKLLSQREISWLIFSFSQASSPPGKQVIEILCAVPSNRQGGVCNVEENGWIFNQLNVIHYSLG